MANDLISKRFGMCVVTSVGATSNHGPYVTVLCDCGNIKDIRLDHLESGATKSCGCYHHQLAREAHTTHGGYFTPEYRVWAEMLSRCNNPRNKAYHKYGGRGIHVCVEWHKFENFIADMGNRTSKDYSIDRINNDGNYEPANCRWATRMEQGNNTRANRILIFDGKSLTITEWSRIIGIQGATIFSRLRLGWTINKALTTPVNTKYHRNEVLGKK